MVHVENLCVSKDDPYSIIPRLDIGDRLGMSEFAFDIPSDVEDEDDEEDMDLYSDNIRIEDLSPEEESSGIQTLVECMDLMTRTLYLFRRYNNHWKIEQPN